VSYFLTHNTVSTQQLSKLIILCIQQLNAVDLNVRAVVCDQAATNVAALKQLGFSDTNCAFSMGGLNHQVYVVFDVPHMM